MRQFGTSIMNLPILFLLLPALAGLLGTAQQGKRYLVINAYQHWTYLPPAEVKRNDGVPAGAKLTGTPGGELTLDCESQGWVAYTCEESGCNALACAMQGSGVKVRRMNQEGGSKTEARSKLGLILTALYKREPVASMVLAARAGGNPSDAVVLQNSQGVHWGPALSRVLEGRYCFRLRHLPVESSGPVRSFALDWDRALDPEGISKVPNLTAGVYQVEKGTPGSAESCNIDPDAAAAWVLVVPEADFVRINSQWKDNSPWFADLDNAGASLSVMATVRHAVLAWLAESVDGK